MTKEARNPNVESKHELAGGAFWGVVADSSPMMIQDEAPKKPVYDLEERTAKFGEAIIRFAKKIPQNPVNNRLIDQMVGAGTSIGANYCEADDGVSKKDFKNKIGTCKKEARETKYFLRMIATAEENLKSEARVLWCEDKELHLIFCKIWRS
ncbi:MAG: four helix bundle protein [Limisphaerales bacterium]|uniref:four helix bundle protein n=1 Tax=Candidatus Binatus sp. TaxID=2811406 RepID=UPI003C94D5C9